MAFSQRMSTLGRWLRAPWAWLALLLLLCSVPLKAQSSLTTSNAFVMADVSTDGEGLVRYFYANGQGISFLAARTSYLTVLVDTTYYTNNPNLVATASPKYPVMLQGGSTKKIQDTIETVWQPNGATGFDIVQDIYPVAFPIMQCGQIVFKFKIRNHESSTIFAQAQYMIERMPHGKCKYLQ